MADSPLLTRVLDRSRRDLAAQPARRLRHAAADCLFDSLVCMAAGTRELAATTPWPAALSPDAGLLDSVAARAMAAHAHDLDDLHWPTVTHPGSFIWPAVVAVGLRRGTPLPQLLSAGALGYQVTGRLSAALGPTHRKFFHASTTCGTVGVAVAISAILDADDEHLQTAMAHAASGMGGTAQALRDRSRTAILHRGFATMTGTLAALNGRLTPAVRDPIGGPFGILPATHAEPATDRLNELLEPMVARMTFRLHPVTGFAHTLIDALHDMGPMSTDRIESVAAEVPAFVLDLTEDRTPRTARAAAWNVKYAAAAALSGRLTAGRPPWPPDPGTQRLYDRITLAPRPAAPPDLAVSGHIRLEDGTSHSFSRAVPHGHPADPLTDEERVGKGVRLGVLAPAVGANLLRSLREESGPLTSEYLAVLDTT